jgi:tRNA U34 5-methylaminomethyl-2-thiouridine-forming methyltransferase MnmC
VQAGQRRLRLTEDGSHTVEVAGSELSYHSTRGAIQESKHVFIEAGLHEAIKLFPGGRLSILEMGFGTGLNALLTAMEAERQARLLHYVSVETFPLEKEIIAGLNYPALLGGQELFRALHEAPWDQAVQLLPAFLLEKRHSGLLEFSTALRFQLIYYDAFAPDAQPELWTQSVFEKLASLSAPGALLTTYCSKGSVRRAMQAAGWAVEKLPGPPGKR